MRVLSLIPKGSHWNPIGAKNASWPHLIFERWRRKWVRRVGEVTHSSRICMGQGTLFRTNSSLAHIQYAIHQANAARLLLARGAKTPEKLSIHFRKSIHPQHSPKEFVFPAGRVVTCHINRFAAMSSPSPCRRPPFSVGHFPTSTVGEKGSFMPLNFGAGLSG